MIVKNTKGQSSKNQKEASISYWLMTKFPALLKIIVLVLLFALAYWMFNNISAKTETNATILHCDAEQIDGSDFITNEARFANGKTRSSEYSYEGKYSSKIDSTHKYGFSATLDDIVPQQRYIVTVRRLTKTPGNFPLAINTSPASDFYVQTVDPVSTNKKGWDLLRLEFTVPDNLEAGSLIIYPYRANKNGVAYFDELKIETISEVNKFGEDTDEIHLYLDTKALNKINTKRDEALENGILISSDNDWAKAKLTENDSLEHDIKLRLKGDWTDHLQGDYWSYRIKMPSDKSWNRMQTFSLQDPKARSYLDEWLYHKALESIDIITPRYGFVKLSQNEKDPVLYVYEEHFEKQIAEYKSRREGVILKFSEDQLWDDRMLNSKIGTDIFDDIYHKSEISPFKESKTLKSQKLKEQFLRAQDLLNSYKNRSADPSEVFDMEQLGKYLAMTEVLCAYHGIIWHNIRFYYNPITRKLEPIGYDGFTDHGKLKIFGDLFFGEFRSADTDNVADQKYNHIYKNPEFNKYYIPALVKYSSEEFISDLINKNKEEIQELESVIRINIDPKYKLDINEIYERASKINRNINPSNEYSIKAYKSDANRKNNQVEVSNYHCLPIELIGTGNKKSLSSKDTSPLLINSNGLRKPADYTTFNVNPEDNYIYYRLPESDNIYTSKIKEWSPADNDLKIRYSENIKLSIPLEATEYKVSNNEISILPGKHILTKPLIIPKNYNLIVEPGAIVDIQKKAFILSYGTFTSIASSSSPILFTSSDKSAQGVTIIKSKATCELAHTSFTNLNTLEENEWQLTGAVTFYESDVNMNNVTISRNSCEDALNIIRSSFVIDELNINNTFGDGFDCDFCKGVLTNSLLFDTGNDGLDFSGSYIELEHIKLKNIGDKGVSAGEQATITVSNSEIDGAEIAIASKDLSKVKVIDVVIKNCPQGFAAYRKKPEFGGAEINVVSYSEKNVERLITKDEESKIQLPK